MVLIGISADRVYESEDFGCTSRVSRMDQAVREGQRFAR